MKLGEKLSLKRRRVGICAAGLVALRFYVFYMICVAIGVHLHWECSRQVSATSFARQFAVIVLLGPALTHIGVIRSANLQFGRYGSLEQLQRSRSDLAANAESGFGKDVDVSTTEGAITTIPLGMLYLLFAPFPWQVTSLRQSITLPEMVVWWASFPLLILGLWYAIKYRLRMISPILIFTVMLTLAYSVVQGNVGTAYRQRAQVLVFYFIFVAVGLVLLLEKRAERKQRILQERLALAQAARTGGRRQTIEGTGSLELHFENEGSCKNLMILSLAPGRTESDDHK